MQALLSNQQNKIAKFQHLKVGADFGEAGTGKTRSTMELVKATEATLCVWIAPFGTLNPPAGKSGIKDEIAKWGGVGCELLFIAPETLSSSDRQYLQLYNRLRTEPCTFMVVDESLKIKNEDAKRTKRIIELGKMCEYKFILNGTPISRNLLDIWPQMEFLSPLILNMRQAEFKNAICEYTKVKKRIGYRWYEKEFITGYANVDWLFSIIEPYVFDCNLDLEVGKQYITLPYTLTDEHKEEYYRLKTKYLDDETLQWKKNNIFLELTQKMQHGYCATPDKFEVLDEFLKTTDRTKVLIYRKFIESDIELKRHYPDIPILSIQSHSMSLNMQQYNCIVKWDKTWDYAQIDQLEHRIYRTGQTETCKFVDLSGNVNLENLMTENVEKKGKLLHYFKDKGYKELMEKL
jgi:SNF2 family DNA or RNA helicase